MELASMVGQDRILTGENQMVLGCVDQGVSGTGKPMVMFGIALDQVKPSEGDTLCRIACQRG